MAEALARLNEGTAYVDAMILVAYLDPRHTFHQPSAALLSRSFDVERGLALVTATLTLDEVTFVSMQELLAQPPFAIRTDRTRYLQRHPEAVRALAPVIAASVRPLSTLLHIEPVTPHDMDRMLDAMASHGLLPRDAIHYAVAQRLGIRAFVSDDDAFDGLPGIDLYKP